MQGLGGRGVNIIGTRLIVGSRLVISSQIKLGSETLITTTKSIVFKFYYYKKIYLFYIVITNMSI